MLLTANSKPLYPKSPAGLQKACSNPLLLLRPTEAVITIKNSKPKQTEVFSSFKKVKREKVVIICPTNCLLEKHISTSVSPAEIQTDGWMGKVSEG